MRKREYTKIIEDYKQRIEELHTKNEDLRTKNAVLEKELQETKALLGHNQIINMTIKEKALPKCESAVCLSCAHCETQTANGEKHIIGCRKDIDCADYMPKPEVIPVPYPLSVPPLPDYNSWTIMNSAARMMNGRLV